VNVFVCMLTIRLQFCCRFIQPRYTLSQQQPVAAGPASLVGLPPLDRGLARGGRSSPVPPRGDLSGGCSSPVMLGDLASPLGGSGGPSQVNVISMEDEEFSSDDERVSVNSRVNSKVNSKCPKLK